MELVTNFNKFIALNITKIVATMWCFYAFSILTIIPLIYPSTQSIIGFVSSSFLQLVLLPLLMVSGNLQSDKSETRAKKDHHMIKTELATLKEEMIVLQELVETTKQHYVMLTEIHNKIIVNT